MLNLPSLLAILAEDAAPEAGGVSVLDCGIVVVLIALAVFVVCRSSRRN